MGRPGTFSSSEPTARRGAPRAQRGAALLVVLTTVTLLTILAVDLAYQRRISLQIAANARDELRAYYLAKSAVNLSRLVLHFQHELDRAGSGLAQVLQPAGGQPAPQIAVRLWEAVPIDSAAARVFLGGGAPAADSPRPAVAAGGESVFAGMPPRAFGDYQGAFQAKIDDEERKVNVPQFANTAPLAGPQLLRFLQLVKDPAYDVLFDREDANGNRWTRADVAAALRDWVDEDQVNSAVGTSAARPFEDGFGDENLPYDRGDDRYRAKNARFDTFEELRMVGGIGDAFLAAFGDNLTVYPSVNAKTNINTKDPAALFMNILAMSDPPGVAQPALLDPAFREKLDAALRLACPLPFLAVSVAQFAQILQALGVRVQPLYLQALDTPHNSFGSRSSTFTIRAAGRAGNVEKRIVAVVTFDERAGPLAADLGRLLHWQEE